MLRLPATGWGNTERTACFAMRCCNREAGRVTSGPTKSPLRTRMTLNAKALPHLKPGRHADGSGLYLTVQKRGTRSWTQVLRVSGRRLDLGVGRYPDVSLKEARRVAVRNRALAKAGVDPRHSTEERMSFATANREYLRWRRFPDPEAGLTRSNQRYKWDRAMANHVLPVIGEVGVAELTTVEVARIASALVSTPSAAKFAMSCIERVCGWAIDSGHREAANPATGPQRQIKVPAGTRRSCRRRKWRTRWTGSRRRAAVCRCPWRSGFWR